MDRGCGIRQPDREGRALAFAGAFRVNGSPVERDQFARERQTQTVPDAAQIRRGALPETFEDVREYIGRPRWG